MPQQAESRVQELAIRDSLLRPPVQHFVNSKTLFATELLIKKVCVVNDLSDHSHLLVTNSKCLLQRLERAVLAAVAEVTVKHVKGHCFAGNMFFRPEGETRLSVNESPNQPSRS